MTSLSTKLRAMPLMWSEALRALVCLVPMIVATALGRTDYLVTLGQGAFFFSSLFLPRRLGARFVMGSLILALGLGFYLIGGAVAPYPWVAVTFTFFVCLNLSYMTAWKVGGPLALTLVMIYTAGLNTGNPEKAAANFLVFAFVMGWSALISLLPFWTPLPPPPVNENQSVGELSEQGLRMGVGTALALAISFIAGFAKIGWAPSAVGNVVRYDEKLSRKRAWARFFGTLGGAAMASIALAFITDPTVVVLIGALFAVLNGLFKLTQLGKMPLFYTATILLLYTANDLTTGSDNVLTRVFYNLVGITIGVLVVIYPFPRILKRINPETPASPPDDRLVT
jgi:Fusaric acid resistance protein-like